MDDDQQFCLRWNNHQSTLVAVFDTLLENETLVDCTLAAEGKCLNAHKVVLSACSPYFQALLSKHFDKHPILILKDVKFQELKAMMDYMYRGEVNISQDQLGALLKAAESLQIKGLSDNRKGETERKPAPAAQPPKSPQPTTTIPKVQGLTIEQRSRDDSREGSMSPGPRKKRRLRRKSEELDNHDASNSSESHSLPAQNIPSSLPAVSKLNADVPEPIETKSEILTRHKQDDVPQVPIIKEKIETHTELMLEPKSEYVEEMNEDSIEDLTLDDDDISNMEQLDDQSGAGPSHAGNAGEGSSQGFGGWHMGNQSQDEVFLAAQEAVGAHRDSQEYTHMYRKGGSIFPNGLDDLLRNSSDGKIVLIRKNNLDNACRQKLVKIIVDYLLNQNNRKHKFPSVLKEAAEEIIKLFPDERIESYYIPYSRQSNVKVCAKGKLYSKWLNSRRALQLAQRPPVTDTEKPASPEITTDEIRNYNQLVQFSLTSFDDCLGIWNNTFQIRMSKLKEFEDPIKYFNHFGVLKQSFGYKLLIEDFNIKYPEAKDVSIHSIWPKISSIIKDTLIRNKHADLLLTMNFPDYQLQSLRALAWMFRPVVLRNKIANKSTKISRTEMADCFITIVETFEELELKIVERREKLKQYDFIFKPFMAAVISPAKVNYLVIIEQQRYTFTDSLHALDALFKIFIALDIPYPLETKVMWQFIDQLVYKISKVVDPGASTVLSEIERYLHIKTEV